MALSVQTDSKELGAARVALEIGTRRAAHLDVIAKALGDGEDVTAAMCMRRFFNLEQCSGVTRYCGGCPVSKKGMGEQHDGTKSIERN